MNRVTLSFDNGPEPEITHAVLDLLDRHGVPASFFVIGQKLDASPDARAAAERAHAAGHWIGNHSYTHATPLGRIDPPEAAAEEILKTQRSLGPLARPDKLFRPFGGGGELGPHLLNAVAAETLKAGGFTCVTWNSVPRDWDDPAGWPARARADCRRLDWALVVLHDIPGACLDELDGFLTWLRQENFEIRQDFPDDCLDLLTGESPNSR